MATVPEARQDVCEVPPGADPELFAEVYNALPYLVRESDRMLLGNLTVQHFVSTTGVEPGQLEIGEQPLCTFASDAITRLAVRLGLPAAREELQGYHYITYFGDPAKPPSMDDIVLCRTWGQFDREKYDDPAHPNGCRPFLGTRRQLAELLPQIHPPVMLQPEGVVYRSVTHRPSPSGLGDYHQWLRTTPEDLATYRLPATGELQADDTTYREWAWGD